MDNSTQEASLPELIENTINVFLLKSITGFQFDIHPTPYKEYFLGTTCGIIWWDEELSAKFKNFKIGFFSFLWSMPLYLLTSIGNADFKNWFLAPDIHLLNLKYKNWEMSFFNPIYLLVGGVWIVCYYTTNVDKIIKDINFGFWLFFYGLLGTLRISYDFSPLLSSENNENQLTNDFEKNL